MILLLIFYKSGSLPRAPLKSFLEGAPTRLPPNSRENLFKSPQPPFTKLNMSHIFLLDTGGHT